MDKYEKLLFKGAKDVTQGKRILPEGTKPRRKKGSLAQDIIDEII